MTKGGLESQLTNTIEEVVDGAPEDIKTGFKDIAKNFGKMLSKATAFLSDLPGRIADMIAEWTGAKEEGKDNRAKLADEIDPKQEKTKKFQPSVIASSKETSSYGPRKVLLKKEKVEKNYEIPERPIMALQQLLGTNPDNVIGPITIQTFKESEFATKYKTIDDAIAAIEGGELQVESVAVNKEAPTSVLKSAIQYRMSKLGQAFIDKFQAICDRNGWNIDHFARVIDAESKFDPTARNKSGASGLLQIMPNVASGLGTSVAAIRKMSAIEQLDIIEKYFQKNSFGKPLNTLEDVYLVTFFPRAIGRGPDYVFSSPKEKLTPEVITKQNTPIAKFSTRKDGLIDGRAFKRYVESIS